jgi:hypothetical protein
LVVYGGAGLIALVPPQKFSPISNNFLMVGKKTVNVRR